VWWVFSHKLEENTSLNISLQLPDTLLWMEEIRSEYILGASADAHMEATSSMSPKLKRTQRVSYRFIRHLYLTALLPEQR
jgi:hypothetical protein